MEEQAAGEPEEIVMEEEQVEEAPEEAAAEPEEIVHEEEVFSEAEV